MQNQTLLWAKIWNIHILKQVSIDIWESDTFDINMDIHDIQSSRFHGYPTPHMDMDIHIHIHSDFWIKSESLTFWMSWISMWISTGMSRLVSGYPFGCPILILDIQFVLWISKPISISNLWTSTLDIQCYPCCFWIFFWISSPFFLDIPFLDSRPPVALLCCLSATFSES